jgi:hypothetical protein
VLKLGAAALVLLAAACAQAPRSPFPWVATVECHVPGDPLAVRELETFFRREVEAGRALPVDVRDEGGYRRWTYQLREAAVATGAFADAIRLSGIEAATVAVHPAAD